MGVILITSKRIKGKETTASKRSDAPCGTRRALGTISIRIKGKDLKE